MFEQVKNGTMYVKRGENYEKLCDVENVEMETIKPVKIKHFTRWGMGWDYHERGYYCPKCDKCLAYFNGVIWTKKKKNQKYCSSCGYKLIWEEK